MKHKFTLGAIAGISTIAIAIPILAQVSSAASSSSVSSTTAQAPAISQSDAEATALAAHPGTLSEATHLDDHFGGYKVEITGADGNEYDVIVNATSGEISDSWIDGQGGPKGGHHWDSHSGDQDGTEDSASSI